MLVLIVLIFVIYEFVYVNEHMYRSLCKLLLIMNLLKTLFVMDPQEV